MDHYAKQHPDFITVTCLEWKPLLARDSFKDVIISSLRFLNNNNRVIVYGFVIMSNHFHLIWQIMGDHKRADVQRDFLKFTGQQMLKLLRNESSPLQNELLVNAKDRMRQVWERNSLSIPLWSDKVMWQKLNYIHDNPVRAGLCKHQEDYKYSSAGLYLMNDRSWDFLQHIDG
jgi:putative transposase